MAGKPRVVIIVQARMGSTRLPGKVLKEILGKPILQLQIERLRRARLADELIVAIPDLPRDLPIKALCKTMNVRVTIGDEENVLSRYVKAAQDSKADVIVRITGDCPLIDPKIIDEMIAFFLENIPHYDYISNVLLRTFPYGHEVEIFTKQCLQNVAEKTTEAYFLEHVTLYIREHPEEFNTCNYAREPDASHFHWTLDTIEDLAVIREIFEALFPKDPHFGMDEMIEWAEKK